MPDDTAAPTSNRPQLITYVDRLAGDLAGLRSVLTDDLSDAFGGDLDVQSVCKEGSCQVGAAGVCKHKHRLIDLLHGGIVASQSRQKIRQGLIAKS